MVRVKGPMVNGIVAGFIFAFFEKVPYRPSRVHITYQTGRNLSRYKHAFSCRTVLRRYFVVHWRDPDIFFCVALSRLSYQIRFVTPFARMLVYRHRRRFPSLWWLSATLPSLLLWE